MSKVFITHVENSSPQKQTGASRTPIPEDQMELSNETLSTDHDVPTMWEEEEVEFGDVISTQPYQIISPPLVSNITLEAPPDETSSETSDDLSVIYQEDPPETLERLTKDLFTAASNADHLSIALFQISGTNTKSKNENDQYPIHCWMLKMAERLKIEPFEFQTMRNLLPSSHRKSMLNHVDALLCTPLSIAITHDVFTWSVFNGFYIQDKRPVTLPVQHIQIKPSEMTSELLQYGATLQDVNRNGYTPWHGLATYIFSREHPNIPGIRLDEHFPLLIIVVVMIVKTFKVVGRMNLNAKDLLGRTGLDYLKERFSKGLLLLSRTDYVDLVRFLTKIGCRFSHQL
jgi:hypothetical protein